jgi:hypothetical protein
MLLVHVVGPRAAIFLCCIVIALKTNTIEGSYTNRTFTNGTFTNGTFANRTFTNATLTNATGTNATDTNTTGTNATGTNATGTNDLIFDKPFIDKAIISAELSLLAQNDNLLVDGDDGSYSFFETLQAGSNRAIVAKKNGTCYVAYGSENPGRFEKSGQKDTALLTFDFEKFTEICFDDCCEVRTLVHTDFDALYAEVEAAVEMCRDTCGASNPCPLILTGHHQGSFGTDICGVNLTSLNTRFHKHSRRRG